MARPSWMAGPRRPAKPSSWLKKGGRGLGAMARHTVSALTFPKRMVGGLVERVGRGRRKGRLPADAEQYAASAIAASEGLTVLSRALANPDPAARLLALDVICEFSQERAGRLIGGMLHDPDPSVRRAAAEAAARVGATGVVFSLILTLDDIAPEVGQAAARAIEQITGRQVGADAAVSGAQIDELKTWWKQQRFEKLSAAVHARGA